MPRIRDLGVNFSYFMGGTCNDPSRQMDTPECALSGPPPPCEPSGPPPPCEPSGQKPPPCNPSAPPPPRCEPSGPGGGHGGKKKTEGLSAAAVAQLRRQMRAQV